MPELNVEDKNNCSICDSEYDETCGGIKGYFGIVPIVFCEGCYSSIIDMVSQHLGLEE